MFRLCQRVAYDGVHVYADPCADEALVAATVTLREIVDWRGFLRESYQANRGIVPHRLALHLRLAAAAAAAAAAEFDAAMADFSACST